MHRDIRGEFNGLFVYYLQYPTVKITAHEKLIQFFQKARVHATEASSKR